MKVGTLPWLIQHELRLYWRQLNGKWLFIFLGIFGLVLLSVLLPASLLIRISSRDPLSLNPIPEAVFWWGVGGWMVGFFFAFYTAIEQGVQVLFERNDLDLLISSILSPKVIFASRLLSIAIEIFLGFGLYIVPASVLALLLGLPQLLGVYPAVVGLSLTAASLGMLITLVLVRLLGAKCTRQIMQIFSSILAALFILGMQLPNLLSPSGVAPSRHYSPFVSSIQEALQSQKFLNAASWFWFPVRAMFGDWPSVLLTLVLSGGLAWLTVEVLHTTFLRGTQESLTQKRLLPSNVSRTQFSGSVFGTMLRKEWYVILRNPYLISQTALQLVFLVPAILFALRGGYGTGFTKTATLLPTIGLVIGMNWTMLLTRIVASGEEAADLLRSSPNSNELLRRSKLLAALIPVWVILFPLCLLEVVRGQFSGIELLLFFLATYSCALLRLWNSKPIPLRDLFSKTSRNTGNDIFLSILETLFFMLWLPIPLFITQGPLFYGLINVAVIVGCMGLAFWRSRQLGTSLGF
jgi:ABC-2 type transport system permease protein